MRPVDPIHFFNARGVSVLTMEHQGAEIDRLKAQNMKLTRQLKATTQRLRALQDEKSGSANSLVS